jgi:toxin ParE1/3/4
MAEYRLTPAAERDLEGIWTYTSQRWSVAQAERYTDELIGTLAELAESPVDTQSQACDYIRQGYRRSRVGRHVVYYRLALYGVAIIRILHERMDATRHL